MLITVANSLQGFLLLRIRIKHFIDSMAWALTVRTITGLTPLVGYLRPIVTLGTNPLVAGSQRSVTNLGVEAWQETRCFLVGRRWGIC